MAHFEAQLVGVNGRLARVEANVGAFKGRLDGVYANVDGVKNQLSEIDRPLNLMVDSVGELLTLMTVDQNGEAIERVMETVRWQLKEIRVHLATGDGQDRQLRCLDVMAVGNKKILEALIEYQIKEPSSASVSTSSLPATQSHSFPIPASIFKVKTSSHFPFHILSYL